MSRGFVSGRHLLKQNVFCLDCHAFNLVVHMLYLHITFKHAESEVPHETNWDLQTRTMLILLHLIVRVICDFRANIPEID